MSQSFLVAGLGNAGSEYESTRHNIGFDVADKMVADLEGKFSPGRYADVAEVKYKGRAVTVIKPTTFMNLSGKAINYWLQEKKINVANLLVIVDELALPLGKIRLGPKGSSGGHNGLQHIQDTIGTTEYPRLRFGIDNKFASGRQVNYVLGKWTEDENKILSERIGLAADAVKLFVFAGLQHAMNQYNSR